MAPFLVGVIQASFAGGIPRASNLTIVRNPNGSSAARVPLELVRGFSQSRGESLPATVQRKMEALFRADFSRVRVHVSPGVASIGASAFTHGSDIFFAPGHYNPALSHGQRLLGHELAHVVQQRQGRVRNPFASGLALVQDPGLEAEAQRMGLRAFVTVPVAQFKPAAPVRPSFLPSPRQPARFPSRPARPASRPVAVQPAVGSFRPAHFHVSSRAVVQCLVRLANAAELTLVRYAEVLLAEARVAATAGVIPQQLQDQLQAMEEVLNESNANPTSTTNIRGWVRQKKTVQNAKGYEAAANFFSPQLRFADVSTLTAQIGNLIAAAFRVITNTDNEGAGERFDEDNCDCLRAGRLTGKTFTQIDTAIREAGGTRYDQEIGEAHGNDVARSRIEWHFPDSSFIALDVPGTGAPGNFEVSIRPHAEKRSPNGVHLSDGGIAVPAGTHSAHIQINWQEHSLKNYIKSRGGDWPYV